MWIAKSNRKGLLDFISSEEPISTLDILSTKTIEEIKEKEELIFVWRNKPANIDIPLPEIILVQNGQIREFLAWVATYIVSFQPFTSFCRVIEISIFNKSLKKKQVFVKDLQGNVILGAVIGEVITHSLNKNIKYITPTAIKSTLSYLFGKSLFLGYDIKDYSSLFENWYEARKLSKQQTRVLESNSLRNVWEVIYKLSNNQNSIDLNTFSNEKTKNIYNACQNIISKGIIKDNVWKKLTNGLKRDDNFESIAYGPREGRIKLFEKYLKLLNDEKNLPPVVSSFLCGYLAFMISPGVVDFADLLAPNLKNHPESIVWYCLCAGLHKKTDLHNYKNGMGWRILRDLNISESIFERPKCDISFEELRTIMDVDRPNTEFITDNYTHMIIEVVPLLYITAHWPPSRSIEQPGASQNSIYNKSKENTLLKLGNAIKSSMELYDDFMK